MNPNNIDVDVLRATLGDLVLQSIVLQTALKAAQATVTQQGNAQTAASVSTEDAKTS